MLNMKHNIQFFGIGIIGVQNGKKRVNFLLRRNAIKRLAITITINYDQMLKLTLF